MSEQTVKAITESGRVFEIPAVFVRDVYAVTARYEFFWEGEPEMSPLSGYEVCHVPTGCTMFVFRSKRGATGMCKWLAKNLSNYDPANPEHDTRRVAMMREIENVACSFGGR